MVEEEGLDRPDSASETLTNGRRWRRSWRFWLGGLLSLSALIWLLVTTDWSEAWAALQTANYGLVVVAACLNLATIPLRTWRWRLLFPIGDRPPFGRLMTVKLIGQAINIFAPFRLGDLVRANLIEGQAAAYVLGSQIFRMALDLLVLASLVVLLLFQVRLPGWWRGPGEALLVTSALVLLGLVALVAGRKQVGRILGWLDRRWPFSRGKRVLGLGHDFLRSAEPMSRPGLILGLVALSVGIWFVYALVNFSLLLAVLGPAGGRQGLSGVGMWLASIFLLVVLQLGVAVPSSPGRVGVYHFLAVQSLSIFGVEQGEALTYAVLLHLISVIMPAALGTGLAWREGIGRPRPAPKIETSP